MPVINHSFPSTPNDPFSNITVEVTDDKVLIQVNSYEKSVPIAISHETAQRLLATLNKELSRGKT